MPDDLPPAPPPPPPAPPPPAPPPPAPPPPAPAPTAAPHRDPESQVAELRAEAAHHRITARQERERAEAATQQLEELRTSNAAAVEAARQPLQQKIEKANQRILTTELRSAAVQAGLTDLDLIPLLDRSKVTVDDEGVVTGITEAIDAFKKAKPEYFHEGNGGNRQQTNLGNRQQTPPRNDPPPPRDTPERVDVRGMTPEQYRAHMAGMNRRIKAAR